MSHDMENLKEEGKKDRIDSRIIKSVKAAIHKICLIEQEDYLTLPYPGSCLRVLIDEVRMKIQ